MKRRQARRAYHSQLREQQAERTRRGIQEAARRMFLSRGFASTTVPAIARAAKVSPKTVAAYFPSKQDLLGSLLTLESFGPRFARGRAELTASTDTRGRVRSAAAMTRSAYEQRAGEFELLRGASGVDPSLRRVATALDQRRRQNLGYLIAFAAGTPPTATPDAIRSTLMDQLLALTSFDVFRLLVREQRWSGEQYERWLDAELAARILGTGSGQGR